MKREKSDIDLTIYKFKGCPGKEILVADPGMCSNGVHTAQVPQERV